MTHPGGQPHRVGDQGQQYEITYWGAGERKKFGWADTPEGAEAMCNSIRLNPGMSHPRVRDRERFPDPAPASPPPPPPPEETIKKRSYE